MSRLRYTRAQLAARVEELKRRQAVILDRVSHLSFRCKTLLLPRNLADVRETTIVDELQREMRHVSGKAEHMEESIERTQYFVFDRGEVRLETELAQIVLAQTCLKEMAAGARHMFRQLQQARSSDGVSQARRYWQHVDGAALCP